MLRIPPRDGSRAPIRGPGSQRRKSCVPHQPPSEDRAEVARFILWVVAILFVVVMVPACKGLPTKRKVERLLRKPPPPSEEIFAAPPVKVTQWDMDTTSGLPSKIGAREYMGRNPTALTAKEILEEDPKRRKFLAGLTCYAREAGRFWLEHKGGLPRYIDRFLRARCALTTSRIRLSYHSAELQVDDSPEVYLTSQRTVANLLREAPYDASIGLWGGHNAEQAVIVLVTGRPTLKIKRGDMVVGADNRAVFTVTVPDRIGDIQAYSTWGRLEYRICDVLATPDDILTFSFFCDIDTTSYYTIVELVVTKKGRVLGSVEASAMFAKSQDHLLSSIWLEDIMTTTSKDLSPDSYGVRLNSLRQQEGLRPAVLNDNQSGVVTQLLPHLLAARNNGRDRFADDVALRMIAGWGLHGVIRGAGLSTNYAHADWGFNQMLSASRLSPAYRAIVFDPEVRTLAVGLMRDNDYGAQASAAVGFEYFDQRDYLVEEQEVFLALDDCRRHIGRAPVKQVTDPRLVALMRNSAVEIRKGRTTLDAAIRDLELEFKLATGDQFRAMAIETSSLDPWVLTPPRCLCDAMTANVSLLVTHHREKHQPWGFYVVLYVYTTGFQTC